MVAQSGTEDGGMFHFTQASTVNPGYRVKTTGGLLLALPMRVTVWGVPPVVRVPT